MLCNNVSIVESFLEECNKKKGKDGKKEVIKEDGVVWELKGDLIEGVFVILVFKMGFIFVSFKELYVC